MVGKNGTESYIVFEVAGTSYGIPSRFVQQLEMVENITPVPNTPAYIEGVMFSRGQVIPVMNLRLKFGLERKEFDTRTRIIVVRHMERVAGLIADSAREYISFSPEVIQPAPEYLRSRASLYIDGIAKTGERIILLFSIPELMSTNEVQLKS